jgi:hypothetical protein
VTAHITLSCDGARSGQSCRGSYHGRSVSVANVLEEAEGWRYHRTGDGLELRCPSAGHDDEDQR